LWFDFGRKLKSVKNVIHRWASIDKSAGVAKWQTRWI
jgi:hypothetical protein